VAPRAYPSLLDCFNHSSRAGGNCTTLLQALFDVVNKVFLLCVECFGEHIPDLFPDRQWLVGPGMGALVNHLSAEPRRQPFPEMLQNLVFPKEDEPLEWVFRPGFLDQFNQSLLIVENTVLAVTGDSSLLFPLAFARRVLSARHRLLDLLEQPNAASRRRV
jgi:hypothetical protein